MTVLLSDVLVHLHLERPSSLAVLGGFLYWADNPIETIERIDKVTGLQRSKVISKVKGLSTLVAISSSLFEVNKTESHPIHYTLNNFIDFSDLGKAPLFTFGL